mmetsp:Transcript_16011/g.41097  ORF Transcript_16011/g.41097 Transcript_16011/m.41097 type:complete len:84 (+) Transcript_16011:255-506(+)
MSQRQRGLGLEAFKFGWYVAVPIAVAVFWMKEDNVDWAIERCSAFLPSQEDGALITEQRERRALEERVEARRRARAAASSNTN